MQETDFLPRNRFRNKVRNEKYENKGRQICEKCRLIRRRGRIIVMFSNPRHKQRQGSKKALSKGSTM